MPPPPPPKVLLGGAWNPAGFGGARKPGLRATVLSSHGCLKTFVLWAPELESKPPSVLKI